MEHMRLFQEVILWLPGWLFGTTPLSITLMTVQVTSLKLPRNWKGKVLTLTIIGFWSFRLSISYMILFSFWQAFLFISFDVWPVSFQGEVEQISLMKPKAQGPHDEGFLEYLEDIIGTNKYVEKIDESYKQWAFFLHFNSEKLQTCNLLNENDKIIYSVCCCCCCCWLICLLIS